MTIEKGSFWKMQSLDDLNITALTCNEQLF